MRARSLAALLAALTLGLTAACSGPGEVERQRVGVAMPTVEQARWVSDGDNLSAQLRALGFDVDMQYAQDDPAAQADQIAEMIRGGADALVVGAVDGTALKGVLAQAHDAGIPVISYDRLIRDTPDVDYYASFDNRSVGVLQGTVLLQGLGVLDATGNPTGAAGPFHVELFAGSPDDNNATVFWDGAMSVLQPYLASGVLQVASGQTTREVAAIPGWKAETAAARMTSLLAPYQAGLRLDGVLAPNDGIAQAVLGAVADLPAVPVVTGQDAELPAVQSVADGAQYATVFKDTRMLAEVAVQMVQGLLADREPEVNDTVSYDNGAKVVPSYLLSPQLVTHETWRALVDNGYYTAQEIGR